MPFRNDCLLFWRDWLRCRLPALAFGRGRGGRLWRRSGSRLRRRREGWFRRRSGGRLRRGRGGWFRRGCGGRLWRRGGGWFRRRSGGRLRRRRRDRLRRRRGGGFGRGRGGRIGSECRCGRWGWVASRQQHEQRHHDQHGPRDAADCPRRREHRPVHTLFASGRPTPRPARHCHQPAHTTQVDGDGHTSRVRCHGLCAVGSGPASPSPY